MQDDNARPAGRRGAVLSAVVRGIGDMPPPVRFDVWKLASIECQIEGLANRKRPIPEDLAVQHVLLRSEFSKARKASDEEQTPFNCHPLLQLMAAQQCVQLRPQIESGDGSAVMEAAAQCAAHGLAMPGWLASAFVVRVDAVISGQAKTWEDSTAFGPVERKGTNKAGAFGEHCTAPKLYEAALQLLESNPNAGLDNLFYGELGEQFGLKSTSVQELLKKHSEGSSGGVPKLSEVKTFLQKGMSAAEAVCAVNEAKGWKLWRSKGGTAEEWFETHKSIPPGGFTES